MQKSDFRGVLPAITTKMTADQEVDLAGVRADIAFQIEGGVDAIVLCGSLGEASSLTRDEKIAIAKAAKEEAKGRLPIVLTIAEDSTAAGASLAAEAEKIGVDGLMVLPAMRYLADDREVVVHYRAVAAASKLPIIIYNNPLAYGINITTEMLKEMADEPKFVAIKESTGDTRRINETIDALGDRYQLLTGVDDLALESLILGCSGWIAGLVVAFPKETVAIYRLAAQGRIKEALEIYRWFLPLLHLDIGPKFVQKIKLCEHIVRGTSPAVRQPRLQLVGQEEAEVRAVVETGLKNRPDLSKYGF
ncbi:dihydrodipicolinate synthase family protein [Chelativorans sp. AA-79]|uniref:dihydrodipicolinate synthase family protein n=1 Tax=Chelativorans sp. AA-79 TaxID=3028735 RepID=UPI0023F7E171|nr:dihydrodipicolinate synthase family protein [Chelativorans sp. AA-79]WEX10551.1 dihydrodipicolinate synthase family protein [Chelativorans sp. AA-79]